VSGGPKRVLPKDFADWIRLGKTFTTKGEHTSSIILGKTEPFQKSARKVYNPTIARS